MIKVQIVWPYDYPDMNRKICPGCGCDGYISKLIDEYEPLNCKCGWTGGFDDLFDSKEEYKNNKRTTLIDKILI